MITDVKGRVVRGQTNIFQAEHNANDFLERAHLLLHDADIFYRRNEDAKRMILRRRPAKMVRDEFQSKNTRPFAYTLHSRKKGHRSENVKRQGMQEERRTFTQRG